MEEKLNNEEMKKAYSEVIAVLRLIDDDEKFGKLPMEFVELIRSKADPLYMPTLSKEKPLEDQNLRDETYSILAWIASKYWNEEIYVKTDNKTEVEEKQEKIGQEQISEEEKTVSVYNDIEEECLGTADKNELLPITYKDLNWFERIKIRVRLIINKIFRKTKNIESDHIY